jgi:phosphatidate cytidylyltransferase
MLKQRVVTAIVMVAVLLAVILWLPATLFTVFISAIVVAGAWEWAALSGLQQRTARVIYALSFVAIAMLLPLLALAWLPYLLVVALVWWLLALVLVCFFPRSEQVLRQPWLLLIAGYLVLVPGWFGLVFLRELPQYRFYILWFIALVASADIGAYFCGRKFGRRKLAPVVSPNKTQEGFVGGVIATCVVAAIGVLMQPALAAQQFSWLSLIVAATSLAVLSVVGDLFESMLKRMRNLKDSGAIFPGHGGVMDRLDSVTAALPLYVLLLVLAQ